MGQNDTRQHDTRAKHLMRPKSAGFSLIELLIALVLGLMLTIGMISVFSGNQRSSQVNAAIANMQENARFAVDMIARDVRMAGFQGCAPIAGGSVNVIARDVPISDLSQGLRSTAIWASEVESTTVWDPTPPFGASFQVPSTYPAVPGTHVLAMQFGDENTLLLDQPVGGTSTPNASGPIFVVGDADAVSNLQVGDLAIISDCLEGDMFEVTSLSTTGNVTTIGHAAGGTTNLQGNLGTIYGASPALRQQSMVMRFNSRVYYVGDTGRVDRDGNAITALYQQNMPFDGTVEPFEIMQGVEQLIISFAVADNDGRRQYVNAGDATVDPTQVTSVRLGLLMASDEEIAEDDDDTVYVLAGTEVQPASNTSSSSGGPTHAGDKRMRLAFNTTIKIRNFRE